MILHLFSPSHDCRILSAKLRPCRSSRRCMHFSWRIRSFKYIIIKIPFFFCAVWKDHFTMSMLNASDPFSFINRGISPNHLSIAISLIILILPCIHIPRSPCKHSMPTLLIVLIFSFIHITCLFPSFPPFAFPVFKTCFEFA